MVRFLAGEARDVADAPRIPRSCLFRPSIRSLIEAARFSCSGLRSNGFMWAVDIQIGSKATTEFKSQMSAGEVKSGFPSLIHFLPNSTPQDSLSSE